MRKRHQKHFVQTYSSVQDGLFKIAAAASTSDNRYCFCSCCLSHVVKHSVFRQNWSTAAAAAASRQGRRAAVWAGAASRSGVENDDGLHLDDTDDDDDAWADRLWEDMQVCSE